MTRLALILAMLPLPVVAETWQPWPGGSSVTLQPSEAIGAVSELLFKNSTNDGATRDYHVRDMGGIRVEIVIGTADPDTITVTPPEGFVAVPPEVTIRDGDQAVVLIYPLDSVGM